MEEYFKNKVVFITGSSKGIGKTTALFLGQMGAKVCINGRNLDSLEKTYTELKENNIECLRLPGDVSDSQQCSDMIAKIIDEYGRLDILVNNAGIGSHGRFSELKVNSWDQSVGINLLGTIYMSSYALPHIIEAKGSIIFISTLAGKVGMPGHSTYSVSKMGLTALAQAMQIELNHTGIHTGIIYVGFTENDEDKKIMYPDGTYKKMPVRKQKKAKREDVARAIARVAFKRKESVTLSTVGKMQSILLRLCPSLIRVVLKKANRDYDNMYA